MAIPDVSLAQYAGQGRQIFFFFSGLGKGKEKSLSGSMVNQGSQINELVVIHRQPKKILHLYSLSFAGGLIVYKQSGVII